MEQISFETNYKKIFYQIIGEIKNSSREEIIDWCKLLENLDE